MKYIYRIDSGLTHCYTVEVGRNTPYRMYRSFADGVHNGKRKALKAAKIYRDNAVKKVGHLIEKRKQRTRTYGKNIAEYWHKMGEWQYLYVRATYYDKKKKKQLSKTLSVLKLGYIEAMKLAKQWRKEKLASNE